MTEHTLIAAERVLFVVGGENDGPGYVIYIGSDGKVHVRRVPGWDPGVRSVLNAAMASLKAAAQIDEPDLRANFEHAAQAAIQAHSQALLKEMGAIR